VSLTTRVLVGLIAGFVLGLLLAGGGPGAARAVAILEPVGALWVNGIRMTVVPLVVASIVVGTADAPDRRALGVVGRRAFALFLAVLVAGAIFSVAVGAPLVARMPIAPETAAALRTTAEPAAGAVAERAQQVPGFGRWLADLVPSNPVRAAADGAMLPLIVFSLLFGLALARVESVRRAAVVAFFRGLGEAILVVVRWVLALAPIGVFALAVPLAARLGLGAAGALAYYIGLVIALCAAFAALVLYPLAVVGGRVSLPRFARASAPAQAVAVSARSSLAALPAMVDGARDLLGARETVTGFFLPLSASTFRAGSLVGQTVAVLFVARLYGIELGAGELAAVFISVILTSFSVPAIPAGSMVVLVPVLLAAGLPVAPIGLLIAIDTLPDMARTTGNVTGTMAVAAVLSRGDRAAAA
jgi:Na+/H+-dicarboxylate symporter